MRPGPTRIRPRRGDRHPAAYPVGDVAGRPAWEGIVVVEPADVRWRCGHAHVVDPDDKGGSHAAAVACARDRHALAGSRR